MSGTSLTLVVLRSAGALSIGYMQQKKLCFFFMFAWCAAQSAFVQISMAETES